MRDRRTEGITGPATGFSASVAICVPSGDHWATMFGYSLVTMVASMAHLRPDVKLHIGSIRGSLIPKQRNALVEWALEHTDATHLLWLDSDIRFPPNTLARLLGHGLSAVCASYTERAWPHRPTAFADPQFTTRVWPTPEATGLVGISAAGMGCMLVKADVYRQLPKPWFTVGWDKAGEAMMGEDIWHCTKLASIGVPLVLDQDLTKDLRHVGTIEYGPEHALAVAEEQGERIPPAHGNGHDQPLPTSEEVPA